MKECTAMFIGHRDCISPDTQQLYEIISNLLSQQVTRFLTGGMGGFDRAVAVLLHRMRQQYPMIQSELVIPYMHFRDYDAALFDAVLFPEELEQVPPRAAILRRNRYMVQQSGTAVCCVRHEWGGAAKTLAYAKKQGLRIISL